MDAHDDLSTPGVLAALATFALLLWRAVPFVWHWYLRNFWWDPDLRSSWSLLSGWPVILFWAVIVTVAVLVVPMLVAVLVSMAVDRLWRRVRP